ncbi:T9SS type A sorting domain-containing protein [Aurantibacillus circumpalustris]|uniref:T9SS type A sorting domain-containing protein n=1 Tax=Aurantibacillus circumpalustris TaxID=3036359 RepID=UPI00295B99D9|nr:T9SS type A sorting domain-containing protein [Aurantibacillus circumpalustris]
MKNLLVIIIFCFISSSFKAQYRKLPLDTNHYWQQSTTISTVGPPINCSYYLKVTKDSMINGKVFKYINSFDVTNFQCYRAGVIREDTLLKIVYSVANNQEYILYNFNKVVGDTAALLSNNSTVQTHTLISKDSVLINDGFYHKRFTFDNSQPIIEGVGSLGGLLAPFDGFEAFSTLNCLARISPTLSVYSSLGLGSSCPLTTSLPLNNMDKKGINIFPNPSTDLINIRFEKSRPKSIFIKNILGQTIMQYANIHLDLLTIEVSKFESGYYFIQLNFENEAITQTFIKN